MSDITLHATEQELRAIRARLQAARGKQFWRSLDELADTPAFQELLRREFPAGAAELSADPVTRRTFLKLMGASLALAGLSGCTFAIKQPQELVAPFARAPYNQEPGIPLYYATATSFEGFGLGVAVKNYDGARLRSRAIPTIPPVWAPPTCSPRPRSSSSTTPTGPRRSSTAGGSAPGNSSSSPSAR